MMRGVSPMNAIMADWRRCLEGAGFGGVVTVLASGNVAFDMDELPDDEVARRVEAAMEAGLGKSFPTIVRPQAELAAIVAADAFAGWALAPGSKRVLTFLRRAPARLPELPLIVDATTIFAADERTVYTAYVTDRRGPLFMNLIERTFGKDVTTRTWQTVTKCAVA